MRLRRLSRNLIDRTFGGVCGGLGAYLGINSWWVRAAFIIFTFFSPLVSVILYLILWLAMPPQTIDEIPPGNPMRPGQARAETLIVLGTGIIFLGIVILAVTLGVLQGQRGDLLLTFVIIGLGLVLLVQQLRRPA
ncbi:MAG: PspC domain-containing protein [Anaerolineae bacterium]|nr:MAG: PspC domain-containing protein [Anaerolineae bacterium]MCL4880247.1 PspC domain-containing protein [Anaerolineae bacterium]